MWLYRLHQRLPSADDHDCSANGGNPPLLSDLWTYIYMAGYGDRILSNSFKYQVGKKYISSVLYSELTSCMIYQIHSVIKTKLTQLNQFLLQLKPHKHYKHISQFTSDHIDGLAQDCSNSIANALELLQFCAKPSISYQLGNMTSYKQRLIHGLE